jgi:hypothetical protein
MTLSFKDRALNSEYTQFLRRTVRERARMYMMWLIFTLITFIPFMLLVQKEVFFFQLACYGSTFVVLLVCEILCCYNTICTEFMLVSIQLVRGFAITLVTSQVVTI